MLFYNDGFRRNTKVESGNPDIVARAVENYGRNSLIKRLQANQCEWCGAENVPLEIHHVRKLKDLSGRKQWEIAMIGVSARQWHSASTVTISYTLGN